MRRVLATAVLLAAIVPALADKAAEVDHFRTAFKTCLNDHYEAIFATSQDRGDAINGAFAYCRAEFSKLATVDKAEAVRVKNAVVKDTMVFPVH